MLFQMLKGNREWWEILLGIFISVLALIIVLPVHEWAHAYTAYRFGDTSQKMQGRMTLNPLKHIDPLGAICLVLVGFGWAKPVYVNTALFDRGGKFAPAAVSLAGPAANLVTGFLFCILWQGVNRIAPALGIVSPWAVIALEWLELFLYFVFIISVRLAVLNLIPVPPFDGYGVISPLLPESFRSFNSRFQKYISLIFFVMLITGVLTKPISYVSDALCDGMTNIVWTVMGG